MKKLMITIAVVAVAAFVTNANANCASGCNHVRHRTSAYASSWGGSAAMMKGLYSGKSMEAMDYGCCKVSSHKKCCKKKAAKCCK